MKTALKLKKKQTHKCTFNSTKNDLDCINNMFFLFSKCIGFYFFIHRKFIHKKTTQENLNKKSSESMNELKARKKKLFKKRKYLT